MQKNIQIKNKKAYFDFEIIDKFIAGIQLQGSEIKSIRKGKARITESFCEIKDSEVWMVNMHIEEYSHANSYGHFPTRTRKLLLNKKEIKELSKGVQNKGNTIVPLLLFINEKGLAKLQIGLAKGKKNYDKRHDLKQKDIERDTKRILKY